MWGKFIGGRNNKRMRPIWSWFRNRSGKMVYSPTEKFKREYKKFPYRKDAEELRRAGRIKIVSPDIVQKKEDELRGKIKSNDEHIVALAMVTGAKLLLSKDTDLINDFENPALVGGNVYKQARAKSLLTPDTCP